MSECWHPALTGAAVSVRTGWVTILSERDVFSALGHNSVCSFRPVSGSVRIARCGPLLNSGGT